MKTFTIIKYTIFFINWVRFFSSRVIFLLLCLSRTSCQTKFCLQRDNLRPWNSPSLSFARRQGRMGENQTGLIFPVYSLWLKFEIFTIYYCTMYMEIINDMNLDFIVTNIKFLLCSVVQLSYIANVFCDFLVRRVCKQTSEKRPLIFR